METFAFTGNPFASISCFFLLQPVCCDKIFFGTEDLNFACMIRFTHVFRTNKQN